MWHAHVIKSLLFKGFELANWSTFSANLACTTHAAGDNSIRDLRAWVAISIWRFVALFVDAHAPGWTMACKSIFLELGNRIITQAGEIIVGFIILAHMVNAEV